MFSKLNLLVILFIFILIFYILYLPYQIEEFDAMNIYNAANDLIQKPISPLQTSKQQSPSTSHNTLVPAPASTITTIQVNNPINDMVYMPQETISQENCALCDCDKLKNIIDTNCFTYKSDLYNCQNNLLNLQTKCINEKGVIEINGIKTLADLTQSNIFLTTKTNALQTDLDSCSIQTSSLITQNTNLMHQTATATSNIIQLQQQLRQCLNPTSTQCREITTDWTQYTSGDDNNNGGVKWLSRHDIKCDEGEYLNHVRLNSSHNPSLPEESIIAYTFDCCKNVPVYTGPGDWSADLLANLSKDFNKQ